MTYCCCEEQYLESGIDMAPKIKLIYFDARGRAEMNRIMLNYGGVEFEDFIIKHEEWEQIKSSAATAI